MITFAEDVIEERDFTVERGGADAGRTEADPRLRRRPPAARRDRDLHRDAAPTSGPPPTRSATGTPSRRSMAPSRQRLLGYSELDLGRRGA